MVPSRPPVDGPYLRNLTFNPDPCKLYIHTYIQKAGGCYCSRESFNRTDFTSHANLSIQSPTWLLSIDPNDHQAAGLFTMDGALPQTSRRF